MNPSVYLDATIPSFYYEDRPGTVMKAWRELTVQFWDQARGRYELFMSDETLRKLQETGHPEEGAAIVLLWLPGFAAWPSTPEVTALAVSYVQERLMPANDLGDAFHLGSPPGIASSTC